MECRILSDLHLEIAGRQSSRKDSRFDIEIEAADADRVLVLAGDIDMDRRACDFALRYQHAFRAVIQVLGNHEYYRGGSPNRLPQKLALQIQAAGADNVHLLDGDSVDVGALRFIGATLWTDFNSGDPAAKREARERMNDFRRIRCGTPTTPYAQRFSPTYACALHRRARDYIESAIDQAHRDGQVAVVVTHHAPYVPEARDEPLLAFSYGSDLRGLIERTAPALWVHGHTHESVDTLIGSTRVISNPRGYAGLDPVADFNPSKVIAIGGAS